MSRLTAQLKLNIFKKEIVLRKFTFIERIPKLFSKTSGEYTVIECPILTSSIQKDKVNLSAPPL
ncbi:MAG: hypothetical protein ACD_79C01048G0003 [uncultured bacterium]|nr:MAG: hypothetical protein ACD_79C01048G0003 [uncultured bacterium]